MADTPNSPKPEEAVDAPVAENTEGAYAPEVDENTASPAVTAEEVDTTEDIDEAQEEAEEDETDVQPAHSPETAQAMGILQVEEYINQQMADIAKLREEMRLVKSTVDDSFQNDAQYRELETKSKEAAKVKNTYKKQMMNDPAVAEQSNKLDGMKAEIRDMSVALSDYLREYNRLTGMSQFETRDGEVLEIVNVFKLVKKKE